MPAIVLPALLDKQIGQLKAHDLDAMMRNYHEDAVVMRPGATARGKAEIREFFAEYLKLDPRIEEIMMAEGTEDLILYYAKIGIGDDVHKDVGTWVLKDGLIWRQTAVLVSD
ncbi:nuclear transport factor 2 family protein [Spongiactinospora sp. TRM90649]|uniref:nuclear transport factor 2 family protein n=1 Tax=Spongiactinospora sp. TRM90649 TaxID=3031114 RepID=UPI0023F7103D|nr:nuclear transport factor 2 family protein [Spongiactinospora sp. TRM90649]MDF5752066.1 nuclear transport factor 2 family protein [Spongiactinospora sp. TRM90649]